MQIIPSFFFFLGREGNESWSICFLFPHAFNSLKDNGSIYFILNVINLPFFGGCHNVFFFLYFFHKCGNKIKNDPNALLCNQRKKHSKSQVNNQNFKRFDLGPPFLYHKLVLAPTRTSAVRSSGLGIQKKCGPRGNPPPQPPGPTNTKSKTSQVFNSDHDSKILIDCYNFSSKSSLTFIPPPPFILAIFLFIHSFFFQVPRVPRGLFIFSFFYTLFLFDLINLRSTGEKKTPLIMSPRFTRVPKTTPIQQCSMTPRTTSSLFFHDDDDDDTRGVSMDKGPTPECKKKRIRGEVFQKSLNSKVSDFHSKDLKTQVAVVVGTRKCECDFHQKIRNQYVERKMGIKFRIFGEGEGKRSAPKGKQFTYDKCKAVAAGLSRKYLQGFCCAQRINICFCQPE
ncbi:hypothetical protein VP01_1472g3 [Puccinia sorghi]|uniref:Uncharacterized protein n=1 Tax=Puccinia sorghi TaxID=27349 RepID=A0A0L6VJT9_9BASI|nr:hypothetical protein VP01_1472g3 [Puccinia sorghi]